MRRNENKWNECEKQNLQRAQSRGKEREGAMSSTTLMPTRPQLSTCIYYILYIYGTLDQRGINTPLLQTKATKGLARLRLKRLV